jgi:hypothetical protein
MFGLRFLFQDMLDEVREFAALANDLIAPGSKGVLPQFGKNLEGYRNANTKDAFDWEIAESNPLSTIGTRGYEPGGGGTRYLIGEITAKWRIRREPSAKKSMPAKYFAVVGLASTRIRLRCVGLDGEPSEQIAMWRMEVGDVKGPGCFFHSQILGESAEFPFPNSLPVPRLPIIMMTPAAVAEFVFAELFQDRWVPHTSVQVPHLNRWTSIQKDRFIRLLNWKIRLLTNTLGSPWSSLKAGQPDDDLFV